MSKKNNGVAELISTKQKDLGMDRKRLAAEIGCSVAILNGWMSSRLSPTISFIPGLAKFLGLTEKEVVEKITTATGRSPRSTAAVLLKNAKTADGALISVEDLNRLTAIVKASGGPMPLGLLLDIFRLQKRGKK